MRLKRSTIAIAALFSLLNSSSFAQTGSTESNFKEYSIDFKAYPKGQAVLKNMTFTTTGSDRNPYYGRSLRLGLVSGHLSYVEVKFNIDKSISNATLLLTHLSSFCGSCFNQGYSPVNITVNGHKIAANFSPKKHEMMDDTWHIASDIRKGENAIRVQAMNTCSHYWLQSLVVKISFENESSLDAFDIFDCSGNRWTSYYPPDKRIVSEFEKLPCPSSIDPESDNDVKFASRFIDGDWPLVLTADNEDCKHPDLVNLLLRIDRKISYLQKIERHLSIYKSGEPAAGQTNFAESPSSGVDLIWDPQEAREKYAGIHEKLYQLLITLGDGNSCYDVYNSRINTLGYSIGRAIGATQDVGDEFPGLAILTGINTAFSAYSVASNQGENQTTIPVKDSRKFLWISNDNSIGDESE